MKKLLLAFLFPAIALAQAPIQRTPFTTNVTAGPIVSPASVTAGSVHGITNVTAGELDVTNNSRFQNATASKLARFDGLKLLTNSVNVESDFQATNAALTALAANPAMYQATNFNLTTFSGISAGNLGQIIWNDGTRWTNDPNGSILLTGATTSAGITNNGLTVYPPSAPQILSVGTTIAVNATTLRVGGNGAAVTLTSTPSIATNGIPDGTWIIVRGTNSTFTVTLQDYRTLAGSCLALWAPTLTLANSSEAGFQWSATNQMWQLKTFSPNGTMVMPFGFVKVYTNIVVGTGTSPSTTMVDIGPAAAGTNGMIVHGGTQTAYAPALIVTQAWNSGAVSFDGVVIRINNNASLSSSTPLRVVNQTPTTLFSVKGSGDVTAYQSFTGGSVDVTGTVFAGQDSRVSSNGKFYWLSREAIYSPSDDGLRVTDSTFTKDRIRVAPPKSTPMGATTSVVLIGLTSTNFTGGAIHYTIADIHAGGTGGTNGVQAGSGVLKYTAAGYNIGGVTNYIVTLNDSTNAAVCPGSTTFGWTWTALTNYIGTPQGFYLQLTPTNTVVDRATTETATCAYMVINNAPQLVTPQ